ncbi:Phage minor tail protein [Sodalis praecaptivus]|uniref:Phage minor tail protein n=1 Tax=Sodalis praecaptivus TaxID=1239307 RepID=W0HZF6_9GAMM|nr:phage tail tube protein [Sodalis praecaptivus]AHF77902.1 Phage minor tail protein [Sodalis praecaptivus]
MVMVAAAGAKQVDYWLVPETIEGDTPATPAFIRIPKTPGELTLTRDELSSNQVRSDRKAIFSARGSESSSGTLNTEFAYGDFDYLLQSLLFNTWNDDVLVIGATKKSFTIERKQTDIDTLRRYPGCLVNTFALTAAPNAIVTADFGIMGASVLYGASAISGATYAEPENNDPFDSTGENATLTAAIKVNGVASNAVTSVSLNIDNGISQAHVYGQRGVAASGSTNAATTGSITFLYQNEDLSQMFYDHSDISLEFTLSGQGGAYTFLLPRIKFSSEALAEADAFQALTFDFTAYEDKATGILLQITRTADGQGS